MEKKKNILIFPPCIDLSKKDPRMSFGFIDKLEKGIYKIIKISDFMPAKNGQGHYCHITIIYHNEEKKYSYYTTNADEISRIENSNPSEIVINNGVSFL